MPASAAAAAVGEQIRRAREQRRLTQIQLANQLGVSQTAISYWEQGRRSPDLDDLVALADVLETDVAAFFQQAAPRRPTRVILRAQADRLLATEVANAVEQFADHAERLPLPQKRVRIASESPLAAARELLRAESVSKPPVPVEQLAGACGVRVLGWDFGEGLSGVLLELDSGPVIGFNKDHPKGRRNFSIAHELGHYLLRHYEHFHLDLAGLATHGEPPGYDWRDERAANDFAAELLMPAELVAREAPESASLASLAKRFGVSREAMGFRLANLGLR